MIVDYRKLITEFYTPVSSRSAVVTFRDFYLAARNATMRMNM